MSTAMMRFSFNESGTSPLMMRRATFHDRSFPNTGIADQHRIVFRAPREHLHDPADLVIAADHRVDFPAPRQFGEIAAVFLERLIFPLRILIGHALRTAHLLQSLHEFVARNAKLFQ